MLAALALLAAPMPVVEDTTLRLPRGTAIEIDAGMRGVQLEATTGDVVTVEGAVADLGSALVITASARFGRGGSPVRVTVPAWARVEITTLGSIDVSSAPEQLEATAINGHIAVHGGTGTLILTAVNGGITSRGFAGRRLEVDAMTGAITIDGAQGTVIASTINDPIQLRDVRSANVEASSVNGNISWSGTLQGEGRYRFESHNGNVTLRFPADVSARLHVTTSMGQFDTRIEGTVRGDARQQGFHFEPRDFTVTYGRGAARVEVETFNGNIRVLRLGDT